MDNARTKITNDERMQRVLDEALDLARSGDLDAIACVDHLRSGRLVAAMDVADAAAESFDAVGDADRAETARWLVEEIDSLT